MRPLLFTAVLGLVPVAAFAQEMPEWLSRLSLHGYISQAYAVSEDHPIFGIPTEGTTDYRDLALQFRYDADREHAFVLQLRQERLGDSPRQRDDVELDWAFYQYNVSERLTFKAGRIPLPLGIFNEAGGPATASPFFRPPNEFYERGYTSKTVEGVLGSVSFGTLDAWSFDVDGYFGQWKVDYGDEGQQSDARNAWGGQVWVNTPVEGVRAGGGAYRCDVEAPYGETADYLMLHASIEADLERWRLATEYLSGDLDQWGRYRAWYAQAGYEVTPRFSVHARGAVARITALDDDYGTTTATLSEDLALSLNYAVHPAVVFKLEGHTNEGFLREDRPQNLYDPPSETRYLIASVVASF
ncbi:MAG TPA: hypothetical protein VF618_21440 [Thermoanaerobaculia bacterium]